MIMIVVTVAMRARCVTLIINPALAKSLLVKTLNAYASNSAATARMIAAIIRTKSDVVSIIYNTNVSYQYIKRRENYD